MLLTPTPCLEMTFSVGQRSIAAAVNGTVREMTASTGSVARIRSTAPASSGRSR